MNDATKAPELLPCPFCDGPAEIWRAHENRTAWISCMGKCSVLVSKEYKTDADAIAAWNRRATPAALAASPEVAALIREAEARGMDRAEVLCQIEIDRGDRNDRPTYAMVARVCRDAIRAEAAALRGEKEPK